MVDAVRANAKIAEKVEADRETEAADAALKPQQKMLLLAKRIELALKEDLLL